MYNHQHFTSPVTSLIEEACLHAVTSMYLFSCSFFLLVDDTVVDSFVYPEHSAKRWP